MHSDWHAVDSSMATANPGFCALCEHSEKELEKKTSKGA